MARSRRRLPPIPSYGLRPEARRPPSARSFRCRLPSPKGRELAVRPQWQTQISISPQSFDERPKLVFGKEALCGSDLSHFHGRLRDRQSGPRRMGRRRNPGKGTLGDVGRTSLDDHLRDGTCRGGSGASVGGRPSADRACTQTPNT